MAINHKEVLENLLHELARINVIIKTSSETISRSLKKGVDKETLLHHAGAIIDNSYILSTHLDMATFQLNPDFFKIEEPDKRNLYGKFYKAILSYRRLAKQRDIEIVSKGDVKSLIDSYPVIEALPILVLDNAVKYTPKSSEIEVEFYERDDDIEVTVTNMGPYLNPSERSKIFIRGYRGEEAVKTNVHGLGFGMSFIEHICKIHHATINLTFGTDVIAIGDIRYSEFKLSLLFSKNLS